MSRDTVKTAQLEDLVEVSVVAMFFVQKLGKASHKDVLGKMLEIQADVNPHLLDQALEALRARGLLSYATGRAKDGASTKMYKPRQIIWSAPPEVAHIAELLPNLVATEEAKRIIDAMNDDEAEGDGTSKSKRKLGYADYVHLRVHFTNLDEFLGSQPDSPWLRELHKKSPYNGVDAALRFWRAHDDGAIIVGADAVSGWLSRGLRVANFGDSVEQYIGVSEIRIYPKRPLVQGAFAVTDPRTGRGAGVQTYEMLQPGETFYADFRIPRRGLMDVDDFINFLADYGPAPLRGLSPARGKRFGKVKVTNFEILEAKKFVAA